MTNFWLNDLTVLFNRGNFLEIIPYNKQNLNKKLNSILRLSIFFSVIMFVLKKDYRYLFIIIITGVLTIIINNNKKVLNVETNTVIGNNDSNNTDDELKGCKLPTAVNPFMNPTFQDYEDGNLSKACNSYDNSVIQNLQEEYFNNDLYRDTSDIFNKNNSQREFYTMPVNSIINDTIKFAEWLYKVPPTCKEGNGVQCASNMSSSIIGVRGGPGGQANSKG